MSEKRNANCSKCQLHKCQKNEKNNLPAFCPMRYESTLEEASSLMKKHSEFYVKSSLIEKKGYTVWPRAREIIEFIKDMGYSDALCTTLITKDRATGHNPAVALYLKDSYMASKLDLK